MKSISEIDLRHILNNTTTLWEQFAQKTILITGGTGFFGKWLLESFAYASNQLSLSSTFYVLSRDPETFLQKFPHFKQQYIHVIKGDIKNFVFPDVPLHYIIHAATEASVSVNLEYPLDMFDTIFEGTKHVLELAKNKKVLAVLHTSSGAVYGKQPEDITHLSEDTNIAPVINAAAAYSEGKRVAEMLAAIYFNQYGVNSKIARCFAFTGPYLPLDKHFAVGNFISDVINGKPIKINGDGTPYRSYLYAADLVIWLLTILLKGEPCRPYNVGSDEDITIAELANMISELANHHTAVTILKEKNTRTPVQRYVPNIDRAKNELGLKVLINLNNALLKTYNFYNADDHNGLSIFKEEFNENK